MFGPAVDEIARYLRETGLKAVAALVKTEAARPRVIGWTTASDRSTVARAVRDVMTADLRPDLGKVSVPVTVLYAFDADAGRPAEAVDALFRGAYAPLKGAKLVRADGSRHFVMFDQPERFLSETAAFLGE